MIHHAHAVASEATAGLEVVKRFLRKNTGMVIEQNPDVVILKYGLLTVEDARRVSAIAGQGALGKEGKVIVIAASRLYHEAQNALLKLLEEPPPGITIFLIVPSIGQLLPTLRSRLLVLEESPEKKNTEISEVAESFIRMSKEKRSVYIKRLATGKDDNERREHRDEALAIVTGLEHAVFRAGPITHERAHFLKEALQLRGYLEERSAPVRMILEHLSLTLPL